MTPLTRYEAKLTAQTIRPDAQQARVVEELTRIYEGFNQPARWTWLTGRKRIPGLYLWGSVGIGKTFLMDLFCDCANFPVERMHFFDFMQQVHASLTQLQGTKNPLNQIARDIAVRTRVLCFDEFFINDIADAMLLGNLFQSLFSAGITLIMTSNIPPDDLYKNGLQRERFIPAIEAIKANTTILHCHTQQDYRYTTQKTDQAYFYPLDAVSAAKMQHCFNQFSHGQASHTEPLLINQHTLPVIARSQGVLWCAFDTLCRDERSQNDYLVLANTMHTVLIDHIQPIQPRDRHTILRFIYLVDILYDNQTRLIMRASAPLNQLYPKGLHAFEFKRTRSRLTEMQSARYLRPDEAIG